MPMCASSPGRKPSLPAAYTRRPLVNVVAFRAPIHEPETMRARTREPTGPKTTDPKCTAMVLEEDITEVGRTKM